MLQGNMLVQRPPGLLLLAGQQAPSPRLLGARPGCRHLVTRASASGIPDASGGAAQPSSALVKMTIGLLAAAGAAVVAGETVSRVKFLAAGTLAAGGHRPCSPAGQPPPHLQTDIVPQQ